MIDRDRFNRVIFLLNQSKSYNWNNNIMSHHQNIEKEKDFNQKR